MLNVFEVLKVLKVLNVILDRIPLVVRACGLGSDARSWCNASQLVPCTHAVHIRSWSHIMNETHCAVVSP